MGGQGIFDFGEEVGAATLVKLVGNFLIGSAALSLREALSMAEKNGVDPQAVVDMLTRTLFPAPIYQSYGKRIADCSRHTCVIFARILFKGAPPLRSFDTIRKSHRVSSHVKQDARVFFSIGNSQVAYGEYTRKNHNMQP
jgi:NAD-binding of NADP-dependent 3-hydroxyisobutyrate dehydrogenase